MKVSLAAWHSLDIRRWATDAVVVISAFLTVIATATLAQAEDNVILVHVHGLGFSADGNELVIPSHHGLAVYRDGRWTKAPGPQHDYMGLVATKRGYYTSGHPAPGSGLVNPFGLLRSDDNGKSWTKLGLEGQSDFHLLAASFTTNAVYVYNTAPNSLMDRAGLYRTLNDGKTWRRAEAAGLEGTILSLAVHPLDPNIVAAGTRIGLFISDDAGAHFSAQVGDARVLSLMFDQDGTTLWASTFDRSAHLAQIEWKSGHKTERALPPFGEDAVAYIARHPHDAQQVAIATFARSVFLSRDRGVTWRHIADRGRTL
ncbi:MAG: F510_1955 family glycosylhydrolase [Burkholderiaceae bacterium]